MIAVILAMAGLLCSAELVRRGLWSEDEEVQERAETEGCTSGCGLIAAMLVFSLLALLAAGAVGGSLAMEGRL